jgi:hypothetical protein
MIIIPDPVYNPNFVDASAISSATKLGPGITIAKFLGAYGDRTNIGFIGSADGRKNLARQLYLHAELIRSISGNVDLFNDVRLIVSEGVYRGGPEESVGGENLKKQQGLMVAYQVINQEGKIDHDKTFDVAEYWKNFFVFENLFLEYDTYNPDGSLTSQIAVEMPTIGESFEARFSKSVATRFNGNLLSQNELIEVKLN